MKKFMEPQMEVLEWSVTDVITASYGTDLDLGNGGGGESLS